MSHTKTQIRKMILQKQNISVDEISTTLNEMGLHLSKIAISGIRAEFKSTLRFLIKEGLITIEALQRKEITHGRIRRVVLQKEKDRPITPTRRKQFRPWHFRD